MCMWSGLCYCHIFVCLSLLIWGRSVCINLSPPRSPIGNSLAIFTNPSVDLSACVGCPTMWLKDTHSISSTGATVSVSSRSGQGAGGEVGETARKSPLLFPSRGLGPHTSTEATRIHSPSASNTTGHTTTTASPIIRDHDASIVELVVFMIITCLDDSSEPPPSPPHDTPTPDTPSALYTTLLAVLVNVLRCYGRRLGKSTEGVDQPVILRGILKGFELLVARGADGVCVLDGWVLPALLHAWPRGGNSVREVAFLKVCVYVTL